MLERFLPHEEQFCTEQQYACKQSHICIDRTLICDGNNDCPYNDDESQCPQQKCKPGFYQCSLISRCIPLFLVCNGIKDCVNGDDELEQSCLLNESNKTETNDYNWKAHQWENSKSDENKNVDVKKETPKASGQAINYSHVGSGIFFINFGSKHLRKLIITFIVRTENCCIMLLNTTIEEIQGRFRMLFVTLYEVF
ncbi:putative Low-density lipoprotein receptor domain class A-like protein, partial [Dinothrombium tinctorium]